jgi:hypothetical protein
MFTPHKIVVCFFGLNRSLSLTHQSIEDKLLRPLRKTGLPISVFGALMHPKSINNPHSCEYDCTPEHTAKQFLGASIDRIDQDEFDTSFDFAPMQALADPWNDNYRSVRNVCRYLHSLRAVTVRALAEVSSPENALWVFLRPDLLYRDALPVGRILDAFGSHGPHLAMTPFWGTFHGLNDRFAVTGGHSARHYGLRLERVREYLEKHPCGWGPRGIAGLQAETFLHWAMHQIPQLENQPSLHVRAWRVRANQNVESEDFTRTHPQPLPFFLRLSVKLERDWNPRWITPRFSDGRLVPLQQRWLESLSGRLLERLGKHTRRLSP